MGFLDKAFKIAFDFFLNPIIAVFNLAVDLIESLFKIDMPEVPAGLKDQGKAYNAELKQNLARLGDVRIDGYGLWRDWPDLICGYTEFEDNDQVYRAYMHVSLGQVEVNELKIGDTPLMQFVGQWSQVMQPGDELSAEVHPNVYLSEEVQDIELRAGISGTTRLEATFEFAPASGPGAGSDRIRTAGVRGGSLEGVPLGTVQITGSGANTGTFTVTGRGNGSAGFITYTWITVAEAITPEIAVATIEWPDEDDGAPTVKAEDLDLVFSASESAVVGPPDSLADFAPGDLVQFMDTDDNSGVDATVLSNDGEMMIVAPSPVNETVSGASVVLVRRRVGPFAACLESDKVERFGVDIVFPQGLCRADDDGKARSRAVSFELRWREIDDLGNPLGSWNAEVQSCYGKAEFKPQRFSLYVDIDPPARVQVDLRRLSIETNDDRVRDASSWTALRGYVAVKPDTTPRIDPDSSRLAVKVRSSARLTRAQQRTVNSRNQRLLPVWDGDSWSEPQATRNPAWALAHWLKAHSNGLITDDHLDLPAFLAFAEGCDTRGDTFDAPMDREVLLWEGAKSIARVGRAKPFVDTTTGKISIYRDEPASAALLFADGINCRLGATAIDTPTSDTPSGVRVKFTDPTTWTERADGPVAGSDADPREVSFLGCTSWARAWAEAYYEYQDLRYRVISFAGETEMEGLLARLGRRVLVGSNVKGWGQVAEVADVDGLQLTLQPPPEWVTGAQHYVHLQGPDGLPTARINCTRISAAVIELAAPAGIALRSSSGWRTVALFGHDAFEDVPASGPRLAIVEGVTPQGLRQASLRFRLDDERVHEDPGTPPVDPYATTGSPPALTVSDLTAAWSDFALPPGKYRITAAWTVVSAAIAYEIQVRRDGQWFPAGTTITNAWIRIFSTGFGDESDAMRVRAVSDGGLTGAWSEFERPP